MQRSVEFGLTAAPPLRFARKLPAAAAWAGPNISFKLLILFLLMVYSSIAVVLPQLNPVRPVLVVALGAILMLVVELAQARDSFKLMWPQSYLVLAFLGVCILSSFTAIYKAKAFDTTSDLAKMILIYLVIENTVTSENRMRKIFLTLVVGGLFPAIGTIHHYMHGILIEQSRGSWEGIFKNPNEDAYSLAVLIPIAAVVAGKSRMFMRLAIWGIIGLYLVAIFVTFSRGGLIGAGAVLGLIVWKQKSYVLRALMIAGLVGSISVAGAFWTRKTDFKNMTQDTTFQQRIGTVVAGTLMFIDHPLTGVGPGDSMVAYPLYVQKEWDCGCQTQLVIHNSFIQVLSETGGPGFIIFMAVLGVCLWQTRKMQKGPLAAYATGLEIALWGFVVSSLSGGFTYTWWPYIFFGLAAALKRMSDAEEKSAVAGVG